MVEIDQQKEEDQVMMDNVKMENGNEETSKGNHMHTLGVRRSCKAVLSSGVTCTSIVFFLHMPTVTSSFTKCDMS